MKTVKVWETAAILRSPPPPHMGKHAKGDEEGEMKQRGEEIHEEPMALVGWPDAAYGDQ